MKLVIDIPEEMYTEYVSVNLGRGNGKTIVYNLLKAIKDGTPLPKGHGRLIDADELEECKEIMNTISGESKYAVRMDDIRSMSTIIEADKEASDG